LGKGPSIDCEKLFMAKFGDLKFRESFVGFWIRVHTQRSSCEISHPLGWPRVNQPSYTHYILYPHHDHQKKHDIPIPIPHSIPSLFAFLPTMFHQFWSLKPKSTDAEIPMRCLIPLGSPKSLKSPNFYASTIPVAPVAPCCPVAAARPPWWPPASGPPAAWWAQEAPADPASEKSGGWMTPITMVYMNVYECLQHPITLVFICIHGFINQHTPTNITGGFRSQGGTPSIIHLNRIVHYQPSSYWGTPINGNPHLLITWWILDTCQSDI